MAAPLVLHPDRLFSAEPRQRALARALYATVKDLPIVSPHGHTDPQWFADDAPFTDASALFITPDHYVFRMLYSQGVRLEDLGIARRDGGSVEQDARKIWHIFADRYALFRGTPTRLWLDHAFHEVFGIRERLTTESVDRTCDLGEAECEALFAKALKGVASPAEAETFRGQMLTEMARMSLEDGLVMQIHPGSFRNHNPQILGLFGRDKGADIPTRTDYVRALKPLLDRFGNERGLTVILFTLDESVYARELAPLAGHYPVLKLGPPWWFHDSPEGMLRFREQATETAGFYNTVGFNDDTRAFLSIPARHDVARRIDCRFLARLVAEHRIGEDEAVGPGPELAYGLARRAYKL